MVLHRQDIALIAGSERRSSRNVSRPSPTASRCSVSPVPTGPHVSWDVTPTLCASCCCSLWDGVYHAAGRARPSSLQSVRTQEASFAEHPVTTCILLPEARHRPAHQGNRHGHTSGPHEQTFRLDLWRHHVPRCTAAPRHVTSPADTPSTFARRIVPRAQ